MSSNLELPQNRFVGRQVALEAIDAAFGKGSRLVTVWGPAGAGKSRLALEYGQRTAAAHNHRVLVCRATQQVDLDGVCHELAQALGVRLGTGEPADEVGEALLRHGKALLILDGLERVVSQIALAVEDWVRVAPQLSVLVTSRERLNVPAEVSYELGMLATPGPDVADPTCEAVALFLERAAAAQGGYEPTERDLVLIGDIVRKLDGMPLAIELAAARLELLGLSGMLERLGNRLDALAGRRVADPRHETLRGAIAWSWDLLSPSAQSALAQASLFRGGFSIDAAEAVFQLQDGESCMEALASLRNKSLLLKRQDGRFDMYESVRLFAHEHLTDEARAATVARHREYFLRFVDEWAQGAVGVRPLEPLIRERDNVRAAIEAAPLDQPGVDANRVARAAVALQELWISRGPLRSYIGLLDNLVTQANACTAETRAKLFQARGASYRSLGDTERAEDDIRAALAACPADSPVLGSIHADLGVLFHQRRELQRALQEYETAREILERANDREDLGRIRGNIGALLHDLGELDDALVNYEAALHVFRRNGNTRLEGIFLTNVGLLRQERGDLRTAQDEYTVALALLEKVGDHRLQAITLTNRGMLHLTSNDLQLAHDDHRSALALLHQVGDMRSIGLCEARLGVTLALMHERAAARESFDRAERILGPLMEDVGLRFIELCRAALALEAAEAARQVARDQEGTAHLATVERAVTAAHRVGATEAALVGVSDDARMVVHILEHRMEQLRGGGGQQALLVTAHAERFCAPGGQWRDLSTQSSSRLILQALIEAHRQAKGHGLSVDQLFAAGWPNQEIKAQSRANRVYVALSHLRKQGLDQLIVRNNEGYLLDPALSVVLTAD